MAICGHPSALAMRSMNSFLLQVTIPRACEDALYRAFSERISVSRRQIFNDLNFMESEAGFRARKGQSVKGSAISMVLNRWRGNGKIAKITESTWKKL